jgi:hypothetical protein
VRAAAALVTICLAVGLSACGGGDSDQPDAATPSADAAAIVRVTDKYVKAFAAKDWRGVCQTRARDERRQFAQLGGSCVGAFKAIEAAGRADAAGDLLRRARARAAAVEVHGSHARVPLYQPGREKPVTTLFAERASGHWLLVDVPDDEQEKFLDG